MLLLAIDCTFGGHSAAVARDGAVLACVHRPRMHATDGLIPSIERALRSARVGLADLGGIAFGAGPGLFSGIRAACATAQGIAHAAGLRVVAVDSALAVAAASEAHAALVAYPAQREHCYVACYRAAKAGWRTARAPQLHSVRALPALAGSWQLCGRGLAQLERPLRAAVGGTLERLPAVRGPLAPAVAALGARAWRRATAPERAAPAYVRTKVAYTQAELARG